MCELRVMCYVGRCPLGGSITYVKGCRVICSVLGPVRACHVMTIVYHLCPHSNAQRKKFQIKPWVLSVFFVGKELEQTSTGHQHEKRHIYNPVWANLLEFSPIKLFSHHRHIIFCLISAAFLYGNSKLYLQKNFMHMPTAFIYF